MQQNSFPFKETCLESAEIGRTKNCGICALKGRFTYGIRQRFLPFLSRTFPRVLKAMVQPTRSSQSAEDREVEAACITRLTAVVEKVMLG